MLPLKLTEARIAIVIRHVVWVGLSAHVGFIPLFVGLGYPTLAGFNVLSVVMWAGAGLANRRGHCSTAMWLLVVEVMAHALLAVLMLGWASGFQFYLVPLIPFVMFNEKLRAKVALIVAFSILVMFVALYWLPPPRALDAAVNHALSTLNMVVPLLALGLVTFHFRLASMDVERTVAAMAATDPLTGLANRRHMNERLREEESRAARSGSPFCVILADIDHFKWVNDSHGHDVGDEVLLQLARLFQAALRTQDIVARWGGEEFLVVLSQTTLPRAREVAERLRAAAESSLIGVVGGSRPVTLTLGVAQYETSVGECLKAADRALYRGKNHGRNQVVVADHEPAIASVAP